MPNDDSHQNTQLQQMRERVATLCQRIKADKDPDAIREVQEQLARVGRIMGRRRPRSRKRKRGDGRG